MKAKLFGAVALCLLGIGFMRSASAQGYSYTTIDVPSATFAFASGINDAGQIVGGYSVGGTGNGSCGTCLGFLYSGGLYSTIIVPPATGTTYAYGINNGGEIVGLYVGSGGTFGYSGSSTLAAPGSSSTSAQGINALGQVVGYDFVGSGLGSGRGFLYSNGVYTTLKDPSASGDTYAYGINNSAQIVGFYDVGVPTQSRGFLYSGGVYITLQDPSATGSTYAFGINNEVVSCFLRLMVESRIYRNADGLRCGVRCCRQSDGTSQAASIEP
jgi:probable HAF family extracellular repeat protein